MISATYSAQIVEAWRSFVLRAPIIKQEELQEAERPLVIRLISITSHTKWDISTGQITHRIIIVIGTMQQQWNPGVLQLLWATLEFALRMFKTIVMIISMESVWKKWVISSLELPIPALLKPL